MEKFDKIMIIAAPVVAITLLSYHIFVDQYIVVLSGSWVFLVFVNFPAIIYAIWQVIRKTELPIVWWKLMVKIPLILFYSWILFFIPGWLGGMITNTMWIKNTAEKSLRTISQSEPVATKVGITLTYELEDETGRRYYASVSKSIKNNPFDSDRYGECGVYQVKTGVLGRVFIDVRDSAVRCKT